MTPVQICLLRMQKLLSLSLRRSPQPCSSTWGRENIEVPAGEPHRTRDSTPVPGFHSQGAFPKGTGPRGTKVQNQ